MLNLSLLFRPRVSLRDRASLPREPGIYYAVDRWGRVRYVGLSNNLYIRWNAKGEKRHHKLSALEDIGGITLYYQLVPEYKLEFVEALEIQRLDPDMNDIHPVPENHKNWRIRLEHLTINIALLLAVIGVGIGAYGAYQPTQPTRTNLIKGK